MNTKGPTLNNSYNQLLIYWDKQTGTVHSPECEDCGADLTGKEVYDIGTMWVCADCKYYREDFHSDV